jgi:transposase
MLRLRVMRAAYSKDFRLHVLSAVDSGMSKQTAHLAFGVSRSTLDDWLKLRQETGDVAATTGYHHGRAFAISDMKAFEQFAQLHNGATLKQMAAAWQGQTGQKVSISTMSVALKRLRWTRKKRVSSTASETRKNAPSISRS